MHFGRSSVICWLNRLSFSPQLTQCTVCIWGGSISGGFIHWLMLYDRKQVAAQVVGSTPRLFTKCRRTIPVQISYEGNSVFNWMWYRPSHAVTPKHRAELLPTQLHRTVYAVGLSNHNVEFCLVSCNKPLKPHLIQTTSHRQASIHNICQTHTWLQYTTNTIYVAVLQENVCLKERVRLTMLYHYCGISTTMGKRIFFISIVTCSQIPKKRPKPVNLFILSNFPGRSVALSFEPSCCCS